MINGPLAEPIPIIAAIITIVVIGVGVGALFVWHWFHLRELSGDD